MKRVIWITLLCVGVSACASDLLLPGWLLELRAREAESIGAQTIRPNDGFFSSTVPAKLVRPIERTEEAYLVQLDIGSAAPVECFVYRKGLDPAASLAAISEATFETIESGVGKIAFKQIDTVDAGALGGSPYLYLNWLYRIGAGGDFQVGEVKHMTAQRGGRTVHCLHNELGYAKTFRSVVKALIQNARYQNALRPEPYFTQISTLTIDGRRVGFEQALLTHDAEGDTRIDLRTSLLVPKGRDELRTTDSFGVEFVDSEGRLINQVHVENVDGELVTHLALDPKEDGRWQVSGIYKSREISREIRPDRPPVSWMGEAFALRRTLASRGVGSEISLVRWMPGADPKRLTDEKLSIQSRIEKDLYTAKLEMAGLEAELVVDTDGTVTKGSVDLGSTQMGIERVYVSGRF